MCFVATAGSHPPRSKCTRCPRHAYAPSRTREEVEATPTREVDASREDADARADARATRAGDARPAEVRRAAGGTTRGVARAARDIAVGDMRATRAVSRVTRLVRADARLSYQPSQ